MIILLSSNGYHLYFIYLRHNIHQEVKRIIRKGLQEKDLSVITVSFDNEKEIEWTKKNKEFRYKGLMYDVVRTEIKNDKKIYYCINDVKEKILIANFTRHNRRKNKVLLELKKLLNNKYFPEKYSLNSKVSKANIYFVDCQFLYKSRFKEILSPPPKFNFYI